MTPPNATAQSHIQARRQVKADRVNASHSSYWMGKSGQVLSGKVAEGSVTYLEQLRSLQRSVAGFVKIVTGKDLPVMFSGGQQSYTDGKSVVISADTDPASMDTIVGTALHEGAHCLLSTAALKILPRLSSGVPVYVKLFPNIEPNAARLGMTVDVPVSQALAFGQETKDSVLELVKMVMNVLEDRRIDHWMYQSAPGYRPYYDAMYAKYWHSVDIDKALQDPAYHSPCVENYVLFVINMTNPHFDTTKLPGLAEIRKLANLTAKGLAARGDEDPRWKIERTKSSTQMQIEDLPLLLGDALKIVEIILQHSQTYENPNAKPQPNKGEGKDGQPSDLPNMDGGRVRIALDRQKKFLGGDLDKKMVSSAVAAQLDQLQKTRASIVEVNGDYIAKDVKAKVIVFRDVTKATVQSHAFPFAYTHNYGARSGTNPVGVDAIRRGIMMGQILAPRIAVTQDESPLTYTRQQTGRLDKRLIAGLGHGETSVFSHTMVERREPSEIWLDVDLSGSMDGEKYGNAMAIAVAVAYAAEKTRTLNCVVAVRDSGSDVAHMAILYDSRRHPFSQLRNVVPYLGCNGGTPEGLCFEASKEELLGKGKLEGKKYFINLSDGDPAHHFTYKGQSFSYGGDRAHEHTKRLMKEFRDAGIKVLSYFIGDTTREHAGFRTMYGKDARFISPTQVNDIIKTINRLITKA